MSPDLLYKKKITTNTTFSGRRKRITADEDFTQLLANYDQFRKNVKKIYYLKIWFFLILDWQI